MDYFTSVTDLAQSTTADTRVYPFGIITGSNRLAQVYRVIASVRISANDGRQTVELNRVSAITAGTSFTPEPNAMGGTAANVTFSTQPTSVTVTGNHLLRIHFNGRAIARWDAAYPDARILIPAGGGTGGSLVLSGQQNTTTASLTIGYHLEHAE